jgi:hypothetical protein
MTPKQVEMFARLFASILIPLALVFYIAAKPLQNKLIRKQPLQAKDITIAFLWVFTATIVFFGWLVYRIARS